MSRIAIDVMGGDNAPYEIIKGCVEASKNISSTLVLVGNEQIISEQLKGATYNKDKIEIIHAEEVITMEDAPVQAIRQKKQSSMVIGLKLLKDKQVDGFISAGSSGALLTGATLIVGRIRGVDRPALAPIIPTKTGYSLLIDSGANADVKPGYLVQFARMGSVYMKCCMGVEKPKVGLINIGVEEEKGNQLTKEAFKLLSEDTQIAFSGNIEARDIPSGKVDVLVCDGFVGNVVLKFMEGFGGWILSMLKAEFMRNFKTKFAALLLKKGIYTIKDKFSYSTKGGAPFLGVKGLVVKTHGSSKAQEIYSTIFQTEGFIREGLIEKLESNLSENIN
ncbi:phosphate--acyl-ACP acyltransferase [Sporanaerobium hydrogeniformans]|uniref:Phosphate--acyl-ACP acyltransferase n=1 Tax=Sporanaerobium hydrogeniformans TaxID=3072179 RepID=A0AC61DE19_9FIRM|nr:phosphate acyltransferase PlsX [Sporanaerobium hydrogeniformans]PHV71110.1 phosphate--acyl-ACP acyltransferase [Sporanaerobium hydrogeniformans]